MRLLPVLAAAVFGLASLSFAVESFDSGRRGAFTTLETCYGTLSGEAGVAELAGGGQSGTTCLRFLGGDKTKLTLRLKTPLRQNAVLSALAERWTGAAPFAFSIAAEGSFGSREIFKGDAAVRTGGLKPSVSAEAPKGTEALVFTLTAPAGKGMKLDNLALDPAVPMKVAGPVTMAAETTPVMKRLASNQVARITIPTEGSLAPAKLKGVLLDFTGTTSPGDIESVSIVRGDEKAREVRGTENPAAEPADLLGTARLAKNAPLKVAVKGDLTLRPGDNHLWIDVKLKDTASIDGNIAVKPAGVQIRSSASPSPAFLPVEDARVVTQRVGTAVAIPGDFNSKFYRIPGLARTNKGTLIAVFDIRYDHSGDLPANIDVGCRRSTDGGNAWSEVGMVIDDATIDPSLGATRGVGDPAILVDRKTGRVWVAAIWSHRASIWGSKSNDNSPEACGQLVLAYSDDDGKSWSRPINITEQTKNIRWRILFNGPGSGICLKDGTLVFAAQYWDEKGAPWSTIVFSRDQGKTWQCGTGVHQQTTEAQVIELKDGAIMINARCNWRGSRVVGVTRDLGKTWELHPTNRKDLREPVCQAGLLAVDGVPGAGRTVFFSNPDTTSGRHTMTLKASMDDASTWPQNARLLYDARPCWGYSCLAPAGKDRLGVLYESAGCLFYLRIPYKDVLQQR